MENVAFYDKEIICPVCSRKFITTKVRSKSIKVSHRDTDFCIYYKGINPLLYDIWVCENCGYASFSDKFDEISLAEKSILKEKLYPKWKKRSFTGERTIDSAIVIFKLALYNFNLRKVKSSQIAKICIRVAWLFRLNNDKEKENEFLKFALTNYMETYEKETFPIDKLDESACQYIIAELHRRLGNFDDSVKWFSRLISSPEARKNQILLENARDQFQLVREATSKKEKSLKS